MHNTFTKLDYDVLNLACIHFLSSDIPELTSKVKQHSDFLLKKILLKITTPNAYLTSEDIRILIIALLNYELHLSDILGLESNKCNTDVEVFKNRHHARFLRKSFESTLKSKAVI